MNYESYETPESKSEELGIARRERALAQAGDPDRPDRATDYSKLFALPVERNDAEVEASIKAFADRQKQKIIEGPIR